MQRFAGSVASVLDEVRMIAKTWNPDPASPEELWFRGVSKKTYDLLPGLYRSSNAPFNYEPLMWSTT